MNDASQQKPVDKNPLTGEQTMEKPASKPGKRGTASAKARKTDAGKPAEKAAPLGNQTAGECRVLGL